MKGLAAAVGGAACVALNFVTAKYAMQVLNSFTFVPLWFLCGAAYTGLYLAARRVPVRRGFARCWRPLLAVGVLHAVSVFAGFTGLRLIDPTVASFLSRAEVLFAVLLGMIVLGERPGRDAWLGMALAVAGIALLTYSAGQAEKLGVMLMICSAAVAATGYLAGKYVADIHSAGITVLLRSLTIATLVGLVAVAGGQFHLVPSWPHLIVLALGAAVGPFAGQLLFFYSIRYISLSEVGVVRATSPVFVAIYAPLLLGMFPRPHQALGGAIALAGLVLLAMAKPIEQRL